MKKTSQELRMLSSVTINCQVTKIVINPGSQLSVLYFSVANTTSPYDCSITEDPKCQIITADVLIINNYCQCLGSLLGMFSKVGR